MTCPHNIIEKDNACADGMCPICLAAENERLNIRIRQDAEAAFQYLNEIDRLKELVAALREEKEKLYINVAEREAEIKRTSRDPSGKVLHDETPAR
jgi:hypothetical protein